MNLRTIQLLTEIAMDESGRDMPFIDIPRQQVTINGTVFSRQFLEHFLRALDGEKKEPQWVIELRGNQPLTGTILSEEECFGIKMIKFQPDTGSVQYINPAAIIRIRSQEPEPKCADCMNVAVVTRYLEDGTELRYCQECANQPRCVACHVRPGLRSAGYCSDCIPF